MNTHAVTPDLTYNIVECLLLGQIDELSINARAGSGGRAGTKTKGAVNPALANNPFAMGVKKTSKNPGGPLPVGLYRLATHESRSNWIRLLPFKGNVMMGRDGFAIHGRGPHGSDGCIVPTDFNMVLTIHRAIKRREDAGKPRPVLKVIAVGDLDYFMQA